MKVCLRTNIVKILYARSVNHYYIYICMFQLIENFNDKDYRKD